MVFNIIIIFTTSNSNLLKMKHLFLSSLLVLLISEAIFSQVPHALNYQTVVRNSIGEIKINKLVSFKISLLQGSSTGFPVYVETQNKVTNEFGLVTIEIGNGTLVSGNFASIPWGSDSYYLKTEFDISGGNSYEFMGTSQLLSVPYSIFAERAGNAEDDHDKDSINELQTLTKVGNNITLSQNGGTVIDSDNQTLSLNGNQLTISTGNTVTFTGAVDLDADPVNELQNLSYSNDTIVITQGNNIVLPHDNDLDSTNEIQSISKAGNTITLSNNGGAVTDSDNQNLSSSVSGINRTINISNGTGVTIDIADNDNNSTNELQYLSFSNDTLSLSNGNSIFLPQSSEYAQYEDIKPAASGGGASLNSSWQIRTLNTTGSFYGNSISRNGDTIFLNQGFYRVSASAPSYGSRQHQIRFYNITDSITSLLGTIEYNFDGSGTTNRSFIDGVVNVLSTKKFVIQHFTQNYSMYGLGFPGSGASGEQDVYTIVFIQKL